MDASGAARLGCLKALVAVTAPHHRVYGVIPLKLNADIVFDNMPAQYGARMDGPKEERLLLRRPQLYEGLERPFEANSLTLVRAERLPQRARSEAGAVIVCIGPSPRLRRYRNHCTVIQVDESCDFYQLFNTIQGIFDTYDSWEHDLLELTEEGTDISRMLTRTEPLLGAGLIALDKDFKLVGVSEHNGIGFISDADVSAGVQSLNLSSLDQYLSKRNLSMERQEPFVIDIFGTSTLNYNLYLDDVYAGCVTAQYGDRPNRPSDAPILKVLGERIEHALRQLASFEPDGKGTMRGAIQDLVEGYPLDSVGRSLFERAAARRSFACMRLKLSNHLQNLPIGYIRNMVESAFPRSIAFEHHRNSVVVFVDLDELDQSVPYVEAIRHALEPFTSTMGMRAGLSDPVIDLLQARLYYLEANIALENGSLFAPDETVHTFQDHVLEDMVIGSLGELPVQMLCPPGLMSLIEHDKVSSTSYLETLRCFLENNTNVTRTAAELFVHRSTLLERLTRIRRELDVDLDDPDMQLRLRMILKVMQISERQAG